MDVNPWKFTPHPEVWLLVAFMAGAYVYMVRVIGPKAVAAGTPPVTRRQVGCFIAAIIVLWAGSDWPIHDIGEDYLYSVHMVQHMMLSYILPPLALLATPTWLGRVLLGDQAGRLYRFVRRFTRPVVAGLIFNFCVMMLHLPVLVDAAVDSGIVHYALHVVVVGSSLLMWMPVCGPLPEFRIGPGPTMIYLFLQSVVPTVPAAWLTFAESPIYEVYNRPVRLWGLSVIDDQQLAGAIMKVIGGAYLWAIVIFLFFKRFARDELTTADVDREFSRTKPPAEPTPPVPNPN